MSDPPPTLVYLEADDEVTSVVRRLRDAGDERVVLVAPGRSRATSSAVALRLLARVGEDSGVRLGVVGDAVTRSLADEAGLETYASVDDARRAVPAPRPDAPRNASIHVVRRAGPFEETATVTAFATPVPSAPIDEGTQTHPVPAPARSTTRLRRIGLAGPLAAVAAIVLGAGILGAAVLPAATVVITPRIASIGPVDYALEIPDAERISGTADADATVTASGTYPIQVAATGVVTLYNFNSFPVTVEAGTFVAAGEQAFATDATIVVPAGSLTAQGTILAGDEAVGVTAAAVGEAANVPAEAIDTVLDASTAAMLRGFQNNTQRLVINPEPTAGGTDTTGVEITQADLDAAVAILRAELSARGAAVLGSTEGSVFAEVGAPPEPVINGLDGLVGTRDVPQATISGTLAYDRLVAPSDEVEELAMQRFAADPTVLPGGHELLADATAVTADAARADGDVLVVDVSVTGMSTPSIPRGEVVELVRGRSAEDAEAALADIGEARVELWPPWVASVPGLDWRIEVSVDEASR